MGSLQVQVREEVSRGRRSSRQVARGVRDRGMVRASPPFRFLMARNPIQHRPLAAESCHSSAICKVKPVTPYTLGRATIPMLYQLFTFQGH